MRRRRNPPFQYEVRGKADNFDSIGASLDEYEILGYSKVPMSAFDGRFETNFYSVSDRNRIQALKAKIQASGWVSPLIVVEDAEGLYVLEGGHRLVALYELGAADLPALVVRDLSPGE